MAPASEESSNASDNSIVAPSSPLYLLPSDSPGTILVTMTFNGTLYGSWRGGILLGLSCKNKLGMIKGTIPKPRPTSPHFEAWIRCYDMVVAWILNSLDKEIRETVMYIESAEKFWKEIEQRFGQGSSSISSYFNRIKKLLDELFSVAYPDCVCGFKETFQRLDEE
ncbi:PREDICTED: uncharacterized protein LOC109238607 [Nicotiana attenuata]|uniref:uncharacterized protein LOC109238607 n=1 Tax=Nicotiana attenuata TaxID=49451 RepID=UPI00090596F9|nr:PREDICTED: uncharacterized protein LOC109238607 [Nicotiana attenuata]